MELQDRIGIRVRKARTERGLTQEALAALVDRSVDTLSLIERGKILPGLDTLDALCGGLGIKVGDVLDVGDHPGNDPDVVEMQAEALMAVRSLSKNLLAVAVTQLAALKRLQTS